MEDFSDSGSSVEDIVESAIDDAATPSLFPEFTSGPSGSDSTTSALLTPDFPTFGAETADDFILGTPRVGENSNFVSAGGGNDKVAGSESVDIVSGGAGDDYLTGGKGDDELSGGEGNDVLDGGEGNDLFTLSGQDFALGGSGADGFVLSAQGVSDVALAPRILDFDPTEGDTLLLPDGIKPEDVFYEIDEAGNTILRLANGRILLVLEGVDLSELFDLDGDGGPVRPGQEELDDRPSGAKDLGILSGERLEEGELTSRDTYDLFKFRVTTSTLLDSLLTPANGADVELSLYQDKNRDGVLTADEEVANTEDDDGTLQSIENYLLKPGEYYLSADLTDERAKDTDAPFSSSYKLNLLGSAAVNARDTAGNSFAGAVNLGAFASKQVNEFLSSDDLADIYRIDVAAGNYLEVGLSGELSDKVSLALVTDNNGTGLVDEDELIEFGRNGFSATGLTEGTYYLVAIADDGASGSYQLDLEMGGGSAVDNELRTPLFADDPVIAQVSRQSRVDPRNANRRFEEYAIEDVFEGDRLSLLISSADGIPTAELIDANANQVKATANPVPGTSTARIDYAIADRRDYVVRIYSPVDKDFNYRLDLTNVTAPTPPATPVARAAAADPLSANPRQSRAKNNDDFLGEPLSPDQIKGKVPAPQFIDNQPGKAYLLDYRDPKAALGLVGVGIPAKDANGYLTAARISDIHQGSLGDCAFLAAVGALFGRVNPQAGTANANQKAKNPAEVSSLAIQSLLKNVSSDGKNYTFSFSPDKPGTPSEQVTIDNAALTPRRGASLSDLNKTGSLAGATIERLDEKTINVQLPGQEAFKVFDGGAPAVVANLKKIKLVPESFNEEKLLDDPDAKVSSKPFGAYFFSDNNARANDPAKSWVNALERAYAAWLETSLARTGDATGTTFSVNGYDAIGNGASIAQTLRRLTGRKVEGFSGEEVFNAINDALDRGDFVGTGANSRADSASPVTIVGGHAYAVTDAYEKGDQKWVVVFNPHGVDGTKSNPQGQQNESTGGKPKGADQEYNAASSPTNDGFIHVPLSDFSKYFGSVFVTVSDQPLATPTTPATPTVPTTPTTPAPPAVPTTPTTPTTPTVPTTPTTPTDPRTPTTPITPTTPTPIVPPPSTLQPQPNGGIAPATPAEFFTLTPQDDRFIMPTVGTGALGKVRALAGNDNLEGSAGTDEIFGNEGRDIAYGRGGDDRLWGGKGNDRLYGNDGNDFLKGEQGNDLLVGDKGNDTLGGGFGNDVLVGGEGTDTLTGGRGADVFALLSPFAVQDVNTADRISDFVGAEGDRIALTDGLTGDSIVLEAAGTATVIRLKSNNAILGVVENAAPADLRDRFTTYGAALNEPTAVRRLASSTINSGSKLAANTAPNNPGVQSGIGPQATDP